ncbi:MAG: PP2C family protein-serine/threonine phosphatase [Acidobacteriaceae bacterium]
MPGALWRSAGLRRVVLLCGCVLLSALTQGAAASAEALPSQGSVHYRFGDDSNGKLGWASPELNDSAWPVGQQGRWLVPAFYSDGFVWVRFRVPVRRDAAEPLAIRVGNPPNVLIADEVFVNGTAVGAIGRLPPHEWVSCLPEAAVFDLPAGLAQPGTTASVVLRLWYPPFARSSRALDAATFVFDQRRTLHAEQDTVRARALLRNLPGMALNGLILLIGLAVLLLARSSRSRDLLLYGAMLASVPWITLFLDIVGAGLVSLSVQEYFPLEVLSQLPPMIVTVVFIWGINDLRDVWFKRLALVAMGIFNLGIIFAFIPAHPSVLTAVARPVGSVALQVFDVVTLGANLWVLFVLRRKRLIAFAMSLVPMASLLVGFRVSFQQGQDLFDLAFFLSGLFLSMALAIEAWREWRARDALQGEFEAAREVQQRLVTPAGDVPGFRIESVYAPAAQVGGDFFRVVPESDGAVLVVVGDVSGKGLKAALTVSAMIGALRTMPPLPPARILAALNRGLVGQMQAGFVTCCAARIDAGGAVTLANAGHLAPYRNGEELPLPPGLPLGITSDAEYEETSLQLAPKDTLTFLSDGVVEARAGNGELFGFERTRAISCESAEAIAEAAQHFGQEDDITVLTLAFAGAEVLLA